MAKYKFKRSLHDEQTGHYDFDWPWWVEGKVVEFTEGEDFILVKDGRGCGLHIARVWCEPLTEEEAAIEEAKIPKKIYRFSADRYTLDTGREIGPDTWAKYLDGRIAVFEDGKDSTEIFDSKDSFYIVHRDWCVPVNFD